MYLDVVVTMFLFSLFGLFEETWAQYVGGVFGERLLVNDVSRVMAWSITIMTIHYSIVK